MQKYDVMSWLKIIMVILLIDEFKCDPNTKGFKSRIPLHHAAHNGYIEIIRKFVQKYRCNVILWQHSSQPHP